MQKWCLFLFHKILITPLHWPNCAWHKWDSSPLDLFIFNDFAFKINLQKGQSWVTKVSVIRSFWSHFFCYGKPWMEKKSMCKCENYLPFWYLPVVFIFYLCYGSSNGEMFFISNVKQKNIYKLVILPFQILP